MKIDGDGDIKIKFDDDGSESGYVKARDVLVGEWGAAPLTLKLLVRPRPR